MVPGGLKDFLISHLTRSDSFCADYLKRESIEQLVSETRAGTTDHHKKLWILLNLELWRDAFISRLTQEIYPHRGRTMIRSANKNPPEIVFRLAEDFASARERLRIRPSFVEPGRTCVPDCAILPEILVRFVQGPRGNAPTLDRAFSRIRAEIDFAGRRHPGRPDPPLLGNRRFRRGRSIGISSIARANVRLSGFYRDLHRLAPETSATRRTYGSSIGITSFCTSERHTSPRATRGTTRSGKRYHFVDRCNPYNRRHQLGEQHRARDQGDQLDLVELFLLRRNREGTGAAGSDVPLSPSTRITSTIISRTISARTRISPPRRSASSTSAGRFRDGGFDALGLARLRHPRATAGPAGSRGRRLFRDGDLLPQIHHRFLSPLSPAARSSTSPPEPIGPRSANWSSISLSSRSRTARSRSSAIPTAESSFPSEGINETSWGHAAPRRCSSKTASSHRSSEVSFGKRPCGCSGAAPWKGSNIFEGNPDRQPRIPSTPKPASSASGRECPREIRSLR